MKINWVNKTIFGLILLFIICRILSLGSLNLKLLNILRIELLILYLVFMYHCYNNKKNLLLLFLVSLFTFQYGRLIYLPLFGKEVEMNWFIKIIPSIETLFFTVDVLFLNLLGIILAENLYKPLKKLKSKLKESDILRNKILIIIVIVLFVPYLKFSIHILKVLNSFKYEDIYKYGIQYFYKQNTALIEQICYSIFLTSISFGLAIKNSSKKSKLFFIIMGNIGYFFIFLRGNRGQFITFLFFSFWYLNYFNIIKLSMKRIVIFLVVLLIPIIMVRQYRYNKEIKTINFSLIKNINDILYSQGTTGSYLVLLNERKDIFEEKHTKYLFSGISGYKAKKQDIDTYNKIIKLKNVNLDHKLSSLLNKELFLRGNGMGGNYIIEMYDFGGKISVFILSFLLSVFLIKIELNIFNYNFLVRSIILYYFPKIFFIPRGNYFISIRLLDLCKIFLVYFLVEFFVFILKNLKVEMGYEDFDRVND